MAENPNISNLITQQQQQLQSLTSILEAAYKNTSDDIQKQLTEKLSDNFAKDLSLFEQELTATLTKLGVEFLTQQLGGQNGNLFAGILSSVLGAAGNNNGFQSAGFANGLGSALLGFLGGGASTTPSFRTSDSQSLTQLARELQRVMGRNF